MSEEFWERESRSAAAQYLSALEYRRREREMILQDEDPSHQTPAYRLWKAKETDAASINFMRKHVVELLKLNHRAYGIAEHQWKLARMKHEESFDPHRFEMLYKKYSSELKAAEATKERQGDTSELDRLIAEAKAHDDSSARRAFRVAARDVLSDKAKQGDDDRAARTRLRDIARWEKEDLPPAVKEKAEQFDVWAKAAAQGVAEVKRLAHEYEPGRILGGAYDGEIAAITGADPQTIDWHDGQNLSLAQRRVLLYGGNPEQHDPIVQVVKQAADFENTQRMYAAIAKEQASNE